MWMIGALVSNPFVVVLPDKYTKAWPGEGACECAEMPLSEALTRAHDTDAHLVQHGRVVADDQSATVRVSGKALGTGAAVELRVLAFDVDDPEVHGKGLPSREEWRNELRFKITRLFTSRHGPGFAYFTHSGARIVYEHAPFTVSTMAQADAWAARYLGHAHHLERKFGISVDKACKHWNALFRLPRVVRDGVRQEHEAIGNAGAIALWDFEPAIPKASARETFTGTVEPIPLDDVTGPLRLKRARVYLEFSAPLSIKGQGGRRTMFQVCAVLVRRMRLPLDTAGDLIEEVYNPRLIAAGTFSWSRSAPSAHGMSIEERLEKAATTSTVPPGTVTTAKDVEEFSRFLRRAGGVS